MHMLYISGSLTLFLRCFLQFYNLNLKSLIVHKMVHELYSFLHNFDLIIYLFVLVDVDVVIINYIMGVIEV